MSFADDQLAGDPPSAIHPVPLPRRETFFPSPSDWRDEVIYFLLPDRFSDGREETRPLLDPANRLVHRPADFRWSSHRYSCPESYCS